MKNLIINGLSINDTKFEELNNFIDELNKNDATDCLFEIYKHLPYINTISKEEYSKLLTKLIYYLGL